MPATLVNMGLTSWPLNTDLFNYGALATDWGLVDQHDHTAGKGVQIPTGGIQNLAIDGTKIAANAITSAKISSTLKPSGSALTTDESLRALGTGAGNAMPGNHIVAGLFGDASDGTATCDGTTAVAGMSRSALIYTLTRDVYFDTLTVNGGGVGIYTAGFRIYCKTLLTLNGSINNNGVNSSSGAGGAGGGEGSVGGGTAGGAGGNGGGSPTAGGTATAINPGQGGAGASGGTSGAVGGGGGGTMTRAPGGLVRDASTLFLRQTTAQAMFLRGGGGGGGGGGTLGGGAGGGGGGGGGIVFIAAANFVQVGSIQAIGGNGGIGTGGAGGGGGGGGAIHLIYGATSGAGSTQVTAGTGGIGGGGTGGTGIGGSIIRVVIG